MGDYRPNDKHKDSLFRIIFGDYKENALSLYNAVNGSNYTDASMLEITTLRDAVYIGIKNDLSFLFNDDLNLYEHQSTTNRNMPLRGLGYFSDMYKAYFGSEEAMRERLYGSRMIPIPAPHYYVFFNGTDDKRESYDLRLSDAYGGAGDVEVVAHVVNVNAGHSGELMSHCRPLEEYAEFVKRIRDNKKNRMNDKEAVEAAIDSCIEDGILADILRRERGRVTNSLITALTEEEIKRLHEYEREMDKKEAREEGLAEGLAEGRTEGLAEGLAEGRAEGLIEGRAEGQDRMAELGVYLLQHDRADDFVRASLDKEYRQQLFQELELAKQECGIGEGE